MTSHTMNPTLNPIRNRNRKMSGTFPGIARATQASTRRLTYSAVHMQMFTARLRTRLIPQVAVKYRVDQNTRIPCSSSVKFIIQQTPKISQFVEE